MKSKNIFLVISNSVSFTLMLLMNYASNAYIFSSASVGDISHKYNTMFAPADYAFTIWSIIFLLNLGFVIYQWVLLKDDPKQYIRRTGLWFTISNIANALWVYCWINEWLGYSVVLILMLLLSLIMLSVQLELECKDESLRTIFFVWWPIAVYLGWIMVATIACIASWLVKSGWHSFNLAPGTWTVIMMWAAFVLYFFLIKTRNLRESAGVGVWAFIAIAIRQFGNHNGIFYTAIITSFILVMIILRHGYRNRFYAPYAKIKRGEWK